MENIGSLRINTIWNIVAFLFFNSDSWVFVFETYFLLFKHSITITLELSMELKSREISFKIHELYMNDSVKYHYVIVYYGKFMINKETLLYLSYKLKLCCHKTWNCFGTNPLVTIFLSYCVIPPIPLNSSNNT